MKTVDYKVEYVSGDYVILQVDHDKLTPELAKSINELHSNPEFRRQECGGDDVQAVIRMFGSATIDWALQSSGLYYEDPKAESKILTTRIILFLPKLWPSIEDLGIWITKLRVESPHFTNVKVEKLG